MSFDEAVGTLKGINGRRQPGDAWDAELTKIISARDEVVPLYRQLFATAQLPELTAEDFRAFLVFKNNRHWISLQRMGPAICVLRQGVSPPAGMVCMISRCDMKIPPAVTNDPSVRVQYKPGNTSRIHIHIKRNEKKSRLVTNFIRPKNRINPPC